MVALGDIIKGILFFIFVQTESSFLRFLAMTDGGMMKVKKEKSLSKNKGMHQ